MKNLLIFSFLLLTLFSCYKLEENNKRYSARKLQKMLEGTWEVTDYQIDGVSYLDQFISVNLTGNCHTYTFTQWKNSTYNKTDKDYLTGAFGGDCITNKGKGYEIDPKHKSLLIDFYPGIIDYVYFYSSYSFEVLKLENNELIITDFNNYYQRKIYFKKL